MARCSGKDCGGRGEQAVDSNGGGSEWQGSYRVRGNGKMKGVCLNAGDANGRREWNGKG